MKHAVQIFAVLILLGGLATLATAEDPAKTTGLTKATYAITGLHCPPCSRTVASSLERMPGVKAVKVDWSSKSAKLTFDEGVISAQKLSQAIAGTPHMMGGGMQYGGWLALSVPLLKDEATGKSIQETLSQVPGVAQVATYPGQHTVSVRFGSQGSVTSQKLIESLAAKGITASTY